MRFLSGSKSIGFLTLHEINQGGYLGSFLITDFKGIPIEFRCTHSIKPDAVQKSLYGAALLTHIGVELCGRPLIRSARKKPRLVLVDKPLLLKLDDYASSPVLYVSEVGEDSPITEGFGPEFQIEVIEANCNDLNPLRLVKKGEMKPDTKKTVAQLYSEFNVLEPFERMGRAVDVLIQRSSRFK